MSHDDIERSKRDGVSPPRPEIQGCTVRDFRQVHENLSHYWDHLAEQQLARVATLHHPVFVHQFGDTAYVIRQGEVVAAYLFGLFSQTDCRQAYIHLVGVHHAYRRLGMASRLYRHFFGVCALSDRTTVTAITSVGNQGSLAFHRSMGMEIVGPVGNYRGDGVDMYVMKKEIVGGAE